MQRTLKSKASLQLSILLLLMLVTISSVGAKERWPLGFGMHSFEQHSQFSAGSSWKCEYPVFEHSKAGDIINTAILKALVSRTPSSEEHPAAKSVEEAASAFLKEAGESQKSETEHAWPWESETKAQVLLDRPGIVTISIFSYAFTGGAHGMSVTSYLVYDTKTGKQLTLDDLFVRGYAKSLDRLIDQRFRQMRGLRPTEPLNDQKGGLFEDKILHNSNFAITGSGVRFLYNQYDIAPYAAGQIEIDLPFDELCELIKPLEALKPLLDEHNHLSK